MAQGAKVFKVGQGEVLRLGWPAPGQVVIAVDGRASGGVYASGTQTLSPGAGLPVCRHLRHELILFVHRGQGRLTIEGQRSTVVPGAAIHIPKESWYGLCNTGTGALEVTWTSVPAGVEEWFRELSRLGDTPDPSRLQHVSQQQAVELGAENQLSSGKPGRAPRPRRGPRAMPQPASHPPSPSVPAAGAITAPGAESPAPLAAEHASAKDRQAVAGARPGSDQPRRWNRRPRHRPPAPMGGRTAQPPGPATSTSRRPEPRGQRRRFKEVYMNGRWVRVAGDGLVISPGP